MRIYKKVKLVNLERREYHGVEKVSTLADANSGTRYNPHILLLVLRTKKKSNPLIV
jgi:hypothetical protein